MGKKSIKSSALDISTKASEGIKSVKKIRIVDEFKNFIARGNVLDLAVGVIIGGAFQNIVKSLTDNIISHTILKCKSFNLSIDKQILLV